MTLSEKQKLKLKTMINQFGAQQIGIKLIDSYIKKYTKSCLTSADLPDTATFGSGLDEVEEFLQEGEYETAYNIASDTAIDMLEDEGFEVFHHE